MLNLQLIYPEIAISILALGLLIVELFVAAKHSRLLYHLACVTSIIGLCLVGLTLSDAPHYQGLGTLWAVDPMSQFFKMLILLTTVLCLLLGLEYRSLPPKHSGVFVCLLLLSSMGMMLLVSSVDLLLTFLSIELISITSFILTGFERANPKSNEGSVKYFLFGTFSAAIMAYGISLFYGFAGTTKLIGISQTGGPLLVLSVLLILLGLGFKASLVPMHFWVPDAYEGAPTPVTAYLSLAPKIATLGAMVRLFSVLLPASLLNVALDIKLTALLAMIAGLTMTVGNFTAFFQNNVKRLLAYSSIAQAGYILIGIVSGSTLGIEGVMLYSFIYVTMNLGAFAVAQVLADGNAKAGRDPYSLDSFNGLSQRSFGLSLAMAFFLLSLSGIPPLAGFLGKFYIFSAAVQSGHYGLAALGVINSVVSVYYYMRIVYHMFFMPAEEGARLSIGPYIYGSLAVAVVSVLLFGIYPEPLVSSVQASAHYLP
ncbi:MAG: NADH-quinone oxidoreductase subunit N [Elusimicrobia bacterium]|nr:NADH-quinone oxidoreductase subunit N [Elusimicrobiota bacterium]